MHYGAREGFYKTLKTDVWQRRTSQEDLSAAHVTGRRLVIMLNVFYLIATPRQEERLQGGESVQRLHRNSNDFITTLDLLSVALKGLKVKGQTQSNLARQPDDLMILTGQASHVENLDSFYFFFAGHNQLPLRVKRWELLLAFSCDENRCYWELVAALSELCDVLSLSLSAHQHFDKGSVDIVWAM